MEKHFREWAFSPDSGKKERNEMKQNMRKRTPLAVLLALCLAMQLCVPAAMASNRLMRAGDAAIAQIEEEEGFRAEKYSSGGKWYIGYGTECDAEDYPEGITREEAELLLMSKVEAYEAKLNDFFDRYDVTPTQGQFDALICFQLQFRHRLDERHERFGQDRPRRERRDAP